MRWFGADVRRLSDNRLMEAVAGGSERAFEELYRRFARRMQGFFLLRTDDADAAADLVQELFLRVWSARGSWRPGAEVTPWLFTLAYNLCRNAWRHREVADAYAAEQAGGDEAADEQVTVRLDAETFDRALAAAVAALPPDDRTLFALRYEEDLALADVAGVMGLPVGTVKSRLHRLTNTLQRKLKGYERI